MKISDFFSGHRTRGEAAAPCCVVILLALTGDGVVRGEHAYPSLADDQGLARPEPHGA